MSEVNSSNEHDPAQSASSGSDWFSGWDDFAADTPNESTSNESNPTPSAATDWQTVNFPNAISIDAIDRQSLYAQPNPDPRSLATWEAQAAPNPSITPPGLDDVPALTSQPSVDDLIGLIQELNQCNNALLDRVSHLEESLEQAQRGIPLQPTLIAASDEAPAPTPEQLTKLTNELEFTRQKDKRQQILLETLKGQLETSQERVAQLERECALTQQRYNEQLQLLNQRENDCRDLRSRLQRQQRYTLQFKAALEKCLEVPPPNYDSAAEAIDRTMVQIPTWYQAEQLSPMLLPKGQTIQPWSSQSQSRFLDKLHLSSLTDEPNLQPLPDSLVEPMASDRQTPDFAPTPIAPVIDLSSIRSTEPPKVSPEVIQAGLEELQLAVNDLWKEAIVPPAPNPSTDQPPEEGEALWQDLARLIDVSADDVVRASLAGDFSLFESIDLQDAVLPTEDSSEDTPERTEITSEVPEAMESRSPSIPFENPNSPSPLVHPLRQLKKITSFAAIDLPNFAR